MKKKQATEKEDFFESLERYVTKKAVLDYSRIAVLSYKHYGDSDSLHVWNGDISVKVYNRKGKIIQEYIDDRFRDNGKYTKEVILKRIKDSFCIAIDYSKDYWNSIYFQSFGK